MDPITAAIVGWVVSQVGTTGLDRVKRLVLGDKQQNALRKAVREAIASAVDETLAADDRKIVREALLRESPDTADVQVTDALDLRSTIQAQLRRRLEVLAEQGYDVDPGHIAETITSRIEMRIRDSIRDDPLKPLADWLRYATVVERLEELKQYQGAAPVIPAQLPRSVAGFTGRGSELALMTGLLDPVGAAGAVVVSALAGLPGVGKTGLAIQAGHFARERGWFAGGIFFIDLHGYDEMPVEPGQALEELLGALEVPAERIPDGAEARAALYRSVLAKRRGPVLLIADNASSEAQVRPLLPGSGPHRVVVTSRHTLGGLDARLLDVAVLDQKAGVALIEAALRVADPDDERIADNPDDAARLAQLCGGLPLALRIVAALLKTDQAPRAVRDLADQLTAALRLLELERLRYDDGSEAGAMSVEAAFKLSYRRLEETAARIFRLLPLNPGLGDVSTAAAAALADLPVTKVRGVLADLARAHLIEAAPQPVGRWRMHDLLRVYARGLSKTYADADHRELALDRLLGYYVSMTETAHVHLTVPSAAGPDTFTGPDDALAWLDAERPNLVAAVEVADDTGRDQVAYRLPVALGDYLAWKSHIDDWLNTADTGVKAADSLGDRDSQAWALNNRGWALQAHRRFDEAITAHSAAAAIFHDVGDRHSEGRALHNLGMALVEVRRLGEAIAAYRQDLEICRETGDRHGEALTLVSLSTALREANRLDEAITCSQAAVAIYREVGGRHGEGLAFNSLAGALTKRAVASDPQGHCDLLGDVEAWDKSREQLNEAITAAQHAAAILSETGDQYNEGMALITLCYALSAAGRFDEVINCGQHAAAILAEVGERHGEGMAIVNLAAALHQVHRVDEAITADRHAAAIFHETGDRHSEGRALRNLGLALAKVQRFDEAITADWDAAACFRETGDRHSEGEALLKLADVLGQVQRFDEAITNSQAAAAIFRATGRRRREGEALLIHGAALRQAHHFEEAITPSQEAAAIFQERETLDARAAGQALLNLAMALCQMNRFDEAIPPSQQAAGILRVFHDPPQEGLALNGLAMALRGAHRFDEAIAAYKDALAIFRYTGDKQAERLARDNLKETRAARRR